MQPGVYTLAVQAKEGDREALARLVERVRMRLFSLAYAETRHYDDAHDVVASALLQVCLHISELRQPDKVVPWMLHIVRNEVRRLRRDRESVSQPLKEIDEPQADDRQSLMRWDIERALRQLPDPQAHALRLFYLAELSVREIAQQMGGSEGAVKMWLHRGRKRLAEEMKGYVPMQPETPIQPAQTPETAPTRTAAIVHSDLPPALIQSLTQGLEAGGYTARTLTPADLGDLNKRAIEMIQKLQRFQLLIFDEQIGGRPALEYVLNVRAEGDTRELPICLLYSTPLDSFRGAACFSAGVDRLINKSSPDEIEHITESFPGRPSRHDNLWAAFTERARKAVFFAQQEAVRRQENTVSTEHLLLGLLSEDSLATRILRDDLSLSIEQIRAETEKRLQAGNERDEQQPMQLAPGAKRVVDLAYDEARLLGNNYIGTEHLLLGLLREPETPAGQVLASFGVELESLRQHVRQKQSG